MKLVWLTALGVGGATVLGSLIGFVFRRISHRFSDLVLSFAAGVMLAAAVLGIGFVFRRISHRFSDLVLSFAAGVMLAAAVLGLIVPSVEYGGKGGLVIAVAGIFAGALCLNLIDRLVPHMHRLVGVELEKHHGNANLNKVLLFVTAIAIHNLPEGIAAGVSFGTDNVADALLIAGGFVTAIAIHNLPEGIAAGVSFGTDNVADALLIAGGIALQNVPEGMVIIGPMLAAGITPGRTFLCALATGLIEVVGTLLGYFAVTVATAILPFALAFAGGTMLYVISDEMIPETHHDGAGGVTYALLAGFCVMLVSDVLLG